MSVYICLSVHMICTNLLTYLFIGTGIVYETPDLPSGSPREFFPLTQLENNLLVMEKSTAHIGHQINGIINSSVAKD